MNGSKKTKDVEELVVPAGFPDAQRIQLAPLKAAIESLEALVAAHAAVDRNSIAGKAISVAIARIRAAIWKGAKIREEKNPEAVARLIDVSADAVRYWCRKGYVRHRTTKSGRYLVDVQSALEHYARS